jgi:hypothetical protein
LEVAPPELLRDVATDAARGFLKEFLPRVLTQLQKAWPWKRRRLLRALPAGLRDHVTDLRACFTLRGPASFIYVISNIGLHQTDEWHFVYDRLRMAAAWFEVWDAMQQSIGDQMNPEFLMSTLAGLNDLLFWTSDAGERLSMLVDKTPKNDRIRHPVHALVDGYNAFLTSYERYLRRLPDELGMRDMRPAQGVESFFSRLRYPERE